MSNELKILGDAPFDDIIGRDPLGYDDFIDALADIITKEPYEENIGAKIF